MLPNTYTYLSLRVTDIIDINLNFPERNREVVLQSVSNFRHAQDVFDGFVVLMAVDLRDAMVTNGITAFLVSPTEILITMPSLAFDLYQDSAGRNQRLQDHLGMQCLPLQLAQDITINEIRMTPSRQTKQLLLRFPNRIRLSNVWDPSTFALSCEMQTDSVILMIGGTPVPISVCRMMWKVGNWRLTAALRLQLRPHPMLPFWKLNLNVCLTPAPELCRVCCFQCLNN